MTKIKLCGLTRRCDIEAANPLQPEYIGFVFARGSRRYITPERAATLKAMLQPHIAAVGVFVNEKPQTIAQLLTEGVIDMVQLHGHEDNTYIRRLRSMTDASLIQAFRIDTVQDIQKAQESLADFVLLDAGHGGTGTSFDWNLLVNMRRPYFLAGGLSPANISKAISQLHPYAVDVSSGIETDGFKDAAKMKDFVNTVRNTTVCNM